MILKLFHGNLPAIVVQALGLISFAANCGSLLHNSNNIFHSVSFQQCHTENTCTLHDGMSNVKFSPFQIYSKCNFVVVLCLFIGFNK